jgi:hypothetical protein
MPAWLWIIVAEPANKKNLGIRIILLKEIYAYC